MYDCESYESYAEYIASVKGDFYDAIWEEVSNGTPAENGREEQSNEVFVDSK